jgi:DNA-binding response OmpR family regulator
LRYAADVVKFGDGLELDRNSYELRRAGRALKLERIPWTSCSCWLSARGQLVTREDIIGKIWGKDVFLDTDSSINGAIRKIRQVLKMILRIQSSYKLSREKGIGLLPR